MPRANEDDAGEQLGSQILEAVVDTAVGAIIILDDRGIIQKANPAAEKIFGFSTRDLLGRNVSILMPEPYRSRHDGYIRRYLETGERRIIGIGRQVAGLRKD